LVRVAVADIFWCWVVMVYFSPKSAAALSYWKLEAREFTWKYWWWGDYILLRAI
jgi:hypothetical protein